MKNQKQQKSYNKELATVEITIGITATIATLAMIAIAAILANAHTAISATIIIISVLSYIIICLGLTKMEQIVGWYKCESCRHKHVPKYSTVLWSMHLGRTRYMSCPKCHKKTWQKKVWE